METVDRKLSRKREKELVIWKLLQKCTKFAFSPQISDKPKFILVILVSSIEILRKFLVGTVSGQHVQG